MIYHIVAGFIASLFAILTFKKLDTFSRLIAMQVFISCLVELTGWQFRIHGHTNTWLYNCYMPVEFTLLFAATSLHFRKSLYPRMIATLILYWVSWGFEIWYYGISTFAVHTYVIGAIILMVCYFFVLYKSAWSRNSLFNQSLFWFSIGVLLFFGCSIPYLSMYDYIVEHSSRYQLELLTGLMKLLAQFRYLCTAIAFIVVFREVRRINIKSVA
ncbi:MAG TPA: hypothetical protein VL092_04355 [Chitinophagaceae bacterium]|nr:hypothetical protein [Chitinophagaceae bacterium]